MHLQDYLIVALEWIFGYCATFVGQVNCRDLGPNPLQQLSLYRG